MPDRKQQAQLDRGNRMLRQHRESTAGKKRSRGFNGKVVGSIVLNKKDDLVIRVNNKPQAVVPNKMCVDKKGLAEKQAIPR